MAWQWTARHRRDGAAAVDVDGVAGDTLGFAFDVPTGETGHTRTVQIRRDDRHRTVVATQTVATGGQARLITSGSRYLTNADEDLTLEGLRLIWERTR